MHNPDPWAAFHQALTDKDEGGVRQRYSELLASKSIRHELLRYAQWNVGRHNSTLVPGFLLDPDEIVDDAFAELLLKWQTIRSDPKKWLLAYIRHRLEHDVSKARREKKNGPDAQRQLNNWARGRKSKSSVSKATSLALREAVNSLPKRMRAVIIALYYRAESVATTATLLGITENTVVQTKRRALKRLHDTL